jgi:hypothetical protein
LGECAENGKVVLHQFVLMLACYNKLSSGISQAIAGGDPTQEASKLGGVAVSFRTAFNILRKPL